MKTLKQWCIENKYYNLLNLYENSNNQKKSDEIGFSSPKIVKWKCNKCNIEWEQSPNKMSTKSKNFCPFCFHTKPSYFYNLCTQYPILAEEWDFEKNQKNPTEYLPNSHSKVWWKCRNGHEWQTRIYQRTGKKKTSCPECRKKSLIK